MLMFVKIVFFTHAFLLNAPLRNTSYIKFVKHAIIIIPVIFQYRTLPSSLRKDLLNLNDAFVKVAFAEAGCLFHDYEYNNAILANVLNESGYG